MATKGIISRSVYADRLRAFSDIAFSDQAAFQFPGRWADFFHQRIGPAFDGRIILEIGCFTAEYLSRIATKYPRSGFVGLDWKCKALYDGAQRIAKLSLKNIALLRARGQDVLKIFAEGELDEVWVFHPDPFHREAELKSRLMAEPFLLDIHAALRDSSSVLALKTDHPGYYQWMLALFGITMPEGFRMPIEAPKPNQSLANRAAPCAAHPRARDLMRPENIPMPSDAIRSRFDVAMNSADYWHDPAALAHTAERRFSGETTLFEGRFIRKRTPIYYFEMQKK